jgi:DNA adenine methylase
MTVPLRPFLKWAGGKRWLFESGQYSLPEITGRYFEPFLGGGAVFFQARPANAVLSDANQRLIELYTIVRDQPFELESQLWKHSSYHSKSYYYAVRGMVPNTPVARAAQFLYLNRTCWNGLYRENLKGQFNVPIGTKTTVIFENDDFAAWSNALIDARLECRDFEEAIEDAVEGDFLFVDPPYTVRHNMNGFVKYNQNIFAWSDQIRLRYALINAARRGVSFALTNADHDSVRELYTGFGSHSRLFRHSVIAGKASDRSFSTELLVLG